MKTKDLALAHIHANGTRVVILEVLERKVTRAAHLVRDTLTRGAIKRISSPAAARHDVEGSALAVLGRLVAPRRLLIGVGLELGDGALAGARESEGGGLEVGLLGEEEDGGAFFARVRGGDIKVEDGAGVAVYFAVVLGAVGLVGVLGVDRDDQVRVLVVAVEVLGAGVAGMRLRLRLGLGTRLRLRTRLGLRTWLRTWLRLR